jgi:hypothetical protein
MALTEQKFLQAGTGATKTGSTTLCAPDTDANITCTGWYFV